MKITFIEEHQSVLSGNSLYKVGAQADLRRGKELIDLGVAYEGWGEDRSLVELILQPVESMSTDELRELAKSKGIKTGRMKRETILERLTNVDN